MEEKQLTRVIQETTLEWTFDHLDFVSYMDVNSGSCGEFALAVLNKLPRDSGVKIVSTGSFLENKGLEAYGENGSYSNHVWLMFQEKHYDIERPHGVKDFMELPYFGRENIMKKLNIKDRELYELLVANEEKYADLIAEIPTLDISEISLELALEKVSCGETIQGTLSDQEKMEKLKKLYVASEVEGGEEEEHVAYHYLVDVQNNKITFRNYE